MPPIAAEAVAAALQPFQLEMPELRAGPSEPSDDAPSISPIADHAPQETQAETASHHLEDTVQESGLHGLTQAVQSQDFAPRPLVDADDGHAPSGFDAVSFAGGDAGLMQALLLAVQAKQEGASGEQVDLPAVGEALAEGQDERALDALIDHFAGHDGAQDSAGAVNVPDHAFDAMLAASGMEGFHAAGMAGGFDMAALAAAVEAHSASA
jgi:hypothetical protein